MAYYKNKMTADRMGDRQSANAAYNNIFDESVREEGRKLVVERVRPKRV